MGCDDTGGDRLLRSRRSRLSEACEVTDPDYLGVIVRDGQAPYRCFEQATHQTCLAHLLRRRDELIRDLPEEERETPRIVRQIRKVALRTRELGPRERKTATADLVERLEVLLSAEQSHDENRKLVKHLGNEKDALSSFGVRTDIDATNWRGEQAIRPAVVNRKVWRGNRTWRGAATKRRVMSVLRTASQQGVDVIEFLTGVTRAPTPEHLPSLFS
ncbi:MAG: IS66 family transposase [Acidimicrobiales bacterium]